MWCVCIEWCFFTRTQVYSFLCINTQRTSETATQYTVLTKLIICCRVLQEKLIADSASVIKQVNYRSHNRAPPVPTQRQFNPMHILHPPFLSLTSNLLPRLRLSLPSALVLTGIPTKTLCTFLSPTCST
jgi:isocitrate dehydrogenase kinase/phosphatase